MAAWTPPLVGEQRLVAVLMARALADTVLNTDLGVGGRIYQQQAPPDTLYPLVTMTVFSSIDVTTLGGRHVWQDVRLLLKVIGREVYYAPLVPIAERLAVLFDGYAVASQGVVVARLRRALSPPEPPETAPGGQIYAFVNQLFRSEVWPLAS